MLGRPEQLPAGCIWGRLEGPPAGRPSLRGVGSLSGAADHIVVHYHPFGGSAQPIGTSLEWPASYRIARRRDDGRATG